MQTFEVTVKTKKILSTQLYEFTLDKPFDFQAGQFIAVIIEAGVKRFYSIASAPNEKDIKLLITTAPGGPGSKYFEKLLVGDKVQISDPMGKFLFASKADSVFVATGTGLAPLISIIKDELEKGNKSAFKLIYGARYEENVMEIETLQELKKIYLNFDFILALTRPKENHQGFKGRVTDYLSQNGVNKNADYYICGFKDMVLDVKNILVDQGIKPEQLHYELY